MVYIGYREGILVQATGSSVYCILGTNRVYCYRVQGAVYIGYRESRHQPMIDSFGETLSAPPQ